MELWLRLDSIAIQFFISATVVMTFVASAFWFYYYVPRRKENETSEH